MRKELSVLIVAHNEEKIIGECLSKLTFADEIVIILDNCSDNTENISKTYTSKIFKGKWDIEGERRNFGISCCSKDWILEIDADEFINAELAFEIKKILQNHLPYTYYNIKVNNYVGDKLIKYGWGSTFGRGGVNCFFKKGCKTWGNQRVHPEIIFNGKAGPALVNPIEHKFVDDVSGLFLKFNQWTHLKALDLIESKKIDQEYLFRNIRRVLTRFLKNYYKRKGKKEGYVGFLIALFAGLFPLVSYLRAKIYLKGFK